MKVTPVKKIFRGHKPGEVFDMKDGPARILIRVGRLASASVNDEAEVEKPNVSQVYETRMMTSGVSDGVRSAPTKRPYVRRNQTAKQE